MRCAHGRREFEFTKWRPKKLDQLIRFEIRPGDPFCFKHWASYDATIVTEAGRRLDRTNAWTGITSPSYSIPSDCSWTLQSKGRSIRRVSAQGIRRGRTGVDVGELGRAWPIRRVKFAMEQRREGRTRLRPVAVFRFMSEDWSPWIAFVRMRERWPELRFDMKAGYLQEVLRGKRRRPLNVCEKPHRQVM
jgi:hypothetical protein